MKYMSKKLIYLLVALLCGPVVFTACDLEEDPPAGPSSNPSVSEITPEMGAANAVLALKGSGLGNIVSVVFEKDSVPVSINPTLNTGEALIFRVPTDAVPGEQNIIFTNGKGVEFTTPFNVLGYATITAVSNYNFSAGEEITLTGKNLADVVEVRLTGTDLTATIVSQTATSITLEMPQTDLNETTLTLENAAGNAVTEETFVDRDNAFVLFADDYAPGYQDASWGEASVITTDEAKSGSASLYKNYAAGNWHLTGIGWTNTANQGFKYLSFWVKGASKDYDLYIQSQQSPSAMDTFSDFNRITVPANTWTYFKIPVDQLKLWANGTEWNQLDWRIQGPDSQDERFYFDDIMFIYGE